MSRILPNLFIVGAPKSGTTAMHQYLAAHPQIFMAEKKEPHFFAPEWAARAMSLQAYLQLFANAGDVRYAGESSAHYLVSSVAASAIRQFNPDSKIIVMLRAPDEMLYSLYYQRLETGNEVLPDFAGALAAEEDRRQGRRIPPRSNAARLQYREFGRYAGQVQRYFDTFGRESVHVIVYDDFRADTASAYRETLRFLGVDPEFEPSFEVVNPNARIRLGALNRFMKRPPDWAKRIAPGYKAILPDALRLAIRRKMFDVNVITAPRPPLDPALRQQLRREFAPEIEALSQLLRRDLTHWCKE